MLANSVSLLFAELRVTYTPGRPHVSNDKPCPESQFKSLNYHRGFPNRERGAVLRKAFDVTRSALSGPYASQLRLPLLSRAPVVTRRTCAVVWRAPGPVQTDPWHRPT